VSVRFKEITDISNESNINNDVLLFEILSFLYIRKEIFLLYHNKIIVRYYIVKHNILF